MHRVRQPWMLLAAILLMTLDQALLWSAEPAHARQIAGRIVDFTKNHGQDRRIHSPCLDLKRNLYVYLPPGFDPLQSYPLLLWLHGFGGDEKQFLRQTVCALDNAIVNGDLPPMIAACPDASLPTRLHRPWHSGSWFINSKKGCWEDFIICDVLDFLHSQFPIRKEREANVIAGWSMGGFGAYNLGMKHPERFRLLVAIYPNLNLRHANAYGKWGCHFQPDDEGLLVDLKWHYKLGNYPNTRFPIIAGIVYRPVWGTGQEAIARMSLENPYEMMLRRDVQAGQFDMYVAYGGRDEYKIDAQAASFVHHARARGLPVWVRYNPDGLHRWDYVNECLPDVFSAVGRRLRELSSDLPELPGLTVRAQVAVETSSD